MVVDKNLYKKILLTKKLIRKVFFHEEYIVNTILASFVSRSHILLLGERGSGKTHVMESLLNTADPNITSYVQGYLGAEIEDVFVRPHIPSLLEGDEDLIWKSPVTSTLKGFDEVQRLGVGALSALFRLLTKGTVLYLDQEEGEPMFWVIATANPWERGNDQLNISLPEPLVDRFDVALIVPNAKLKYQLQIDERVEKMKQELPMIWTKDELIKLWETVKKIKIPYELRLVMTLMNRIMQFCDKCEGNDASTIDPERKRELCMKCNQSYICSQIARPPSVRPLLSLMKLAKGFAFLDGRDTVTLDDVKEAFPHVYRHRIEFMDEHEIVNKKKKLDELCERLIQEILEVKEAFEIIDKLRQKYDEGLYKKLEQYTNAKPWMIEVKEIIDDYYEEKHEDTYLKFLSTSDVVKKAKIYYVVKKKLPRKFLDAYKFDVKIRAKITPKVLATFGREFPEWYTVLKSLREQYGQEVELSGELAILYIAFFPNQFSLISFSEKKNEG